MISILWLRRTGHSKDEKLAQSHRAGVRGGVQTQAVWCQRQWSWPILCNILIIDTEILSILSIYQSTILERCVLP